MQERRGEDWDLGEKRGKGEETSGINLILKNNTLLVGDIHASYENSFSFQFILNLSTGIKTLLSFRLCKTKLVSKISGISLFINSEHNQQSERIVLNINFFFNILNLGPTYRHKQEGPTTTQYTNEEENLCII